MAQDCRPRGVRFLYALRDLTLSTVKEGAIRAKTIWINRCARDANCGYPDCRKALVFSLEIPDCALTKQFESCTSNSKAPESRSLLGIVLASLGFIGTAAVLANGPAPPARESSAARNDGRHTAGSSGLGEFRCRAQCPDDGRPDSRRHLRLAGGAIDRDPDDVASAGRSDLEESGGLPVRHRRKN